ncbi:hypothetical protein W97_03134 [Coniosporium apollinis CBS 100218]|uniref:Frequency clock protein n=1 Tax=Coniosporium apollinis (strain CBS 100218) TaxID=1168221 RepID=R7YQF1_CONA1|nr:uncharacterized protein W97_03134 [Coniosporium apollinis CBS 100218]EON63906.1 hypothetical protein W97_03134 [Coniosporium apollinis CBS 100218]
MASSGQRSLAPHPRRPPAHKSVSLPHSPTKQNPYTDSPTQAYPPSQSAPRSPSSNEVNPSSSYSSKSNNIVKKHSSGESSDPGQWFERSNNNFTQSTASFMDTDEPPFFLRNSSSSNTTPDQQMRPSLTALPYRNQLTQLETEGSSADEFRSVIDDLTIENKKLKRKLRKYEKLYDAHLQDEKLFEIRVHKLPSSKKRELEETLKKFAMGIDENLESEPIGNGFDRPTPRLKPHQTTSSYTSTRVADSAYASASLSGQTSTAPSGHDSNHRQMTKSELFRQQRTIQSYLHDIPAGLLPKPAVAMTERDKKKLVVRRLEQIFTGKGPGSGDHQQPLQQQEVAQSAARADRRATEASGQHARGEGLRQARIMLEEADDQSRPQEQGPVESTQRLNSAMKVSEQDLADQRSPDQRPTRPLDLNPQRAQVPEDNLQYIRHLGFSPMDLDANEAQEDGHGWIYLNLLIGMAQLHTINVTPEFVRSAVTDLSSKFEMSEDGRKIRWKGGRDRTRMSSDSPSSGRSGRSSPAEDMAVQRFGQKRRKLGHDGSDSASEQVLNRKTLATQLAKEKERFAYTPLFFHKEETDDDYVVSKAEESDAESSPPAYVPGNSSGFPNFGMAPFARKRRADGPIIFYNKANFCTDLSGDSKLNSHASTHTPIYSSVTSYPIGTDSKPAHESTGDLAETRRPLDHVKSLYDRISQMDLDDSDVALRIHSDPIKTPAAILPLSRPAPFEVSGVGGVYPADHFAIHVQCRQTRVKGRPAPAFKVPMRYPRKIQRLLEQRHKDYLISRPAAHNSRAVPGPTIRTEVIAARKRDLPASVLPPPIHFNPCASASASEDEDDEDEDKASDSDSNVDSDSDAPSAATSDHPAAAPQPLNLALFPSDALSSRTPSLSAEESTSTSSSPSSDDDDDGDDDESVDLLATARALDPATIRAREREYDANMAERLAEEIPAGSSAATAGGGSGFVSPASQGGAKGVKRGSGKRV